MKLYEKAIEEHLEERIKALGGVCAKFVSPGRRGRTDRLCKLPTMPAFLAELKREGEVPTRQQVREHARWRAVNMPVHVFDSKAAIDAFLGSLS